MIYEFVLELLNDLEPRVKPMFGVKSIYIGEKLYLALRKKEKNPVDNGVWLGCEFEHHESLKATFPSLRKLQTIPINKWLILPEDADDFEEAVTRVCELIKRGDPRIGVVPKPKKKKKK